jgi:hypothetical protein
MPQIKQDVAERASAAFRRSATPRWNGVELRDVRRRSEPAAIHYLTSTSGH